MKPGSNYLDQLTDKTRSYKVRVKVIDKARPQQSPEKGTRYQRLVLRDEKGNTMRACLFNEEIDGFEHVLKRNGEYEIADATIKPVGQNYQVKPNEFQMSNLSKAIIQPINNEGVDLSPQYCTIASVPRTADADDRYDLPGIVIFVEDTRKMKTTQDKKIEVREIIITDHSTEQIMIISAWNDLAGQDCNILSMWAKQSVVIGFTALKATKHKGFSLSTKMSSLIIHDPKGEKADALRSWATENNTLLEDRLAKVLEVRFPPKERSIVTLEQLSHKEAANTMQEERHWLKVIIPEPNHKHVRIYLGCSNCSKRGDIVKGVAYKCTACNHKDCISTPKMTFTFDTSDGTGSMNFIAFNDDVEKLFKTKASEIYEMKRDDEIKTFHNISKQLRKEPFYIQVGPDISLLRTGYLKWILKSISLE